jgi:hypothetical protein
VNRDRPIPPVPQVGWTIADENTKPRRVSDSIGPQRAYPCSIDATAPINAASQSTPAAIACTKKPVSRFSAASV